VTALRPDRIMLPFGILRCRNQQVPAKTEQLVGVDAIAELALTEQRIKANARPLWRRLLQKAR
jgi:hypothetical protein